MKQSARIVNSNLIARVADHIEIEIGDTKQPLPFPQCKSLHWDNECNFSLRLADNEPGVPEWLVTEQGATWQKGNRKAVFIHTPGHVAFEVHLLAPPPSNILEFTIQTKGLDFFYQPHEVVAEDGEIHDRPDNVKGSYAVYHNSKANNQYKTGKAFHLYRPEVIDASGNREWCELEIDAEQGLLREILPAEFMKTATYPLIVR